MKLTKKLRAAVLKQFMDGQSAVYLAGVFENPVKRIEQVVRDEIARLRAIELVFRRDSLEINVGADLQVRPEDQAHG